MISQMELLKNRLTNITVVNTVTWGVFKAHALFYIEDFLFFQGKECPNPTHAPPNPFIKPVYQLQHTEAGIWCTGKNKL